MAEGGVFEGPLGADAGEGPADRAAGSVDPFAAALAVSAGERGAAFDPRAVAYLEKQAQLADLQLRHFHEDRRIATGAANRKRFGDHLRNGFGVAVALAAAIVAAALIAMAWEAAHDHGLVVEAFSAPPDLAARGLTGQVVARQVLDRLSDLQAQTVTLRA